MQTLARLTATILIIAMLCAQAVALPKRPRPPTPKPKRPSNSHLLLKANSKSALLKAAANAGKSKLLSARNAGKSHLLSARNAGKSHLLSARHGNKSALLSNARKHSHSHKNNAALLLSARRHDHSGNAHRHPQKNLASRAAAAAAHHHSLLQARRSGHNFKTAKHNAGPNTANHAHLLLQQQKNPPKFHLLNNAARRSSQANNISVGSRGGQMSLDNERGIQSGNRMEDPRRGVAIPNGKTEASDSFVDPLNERTE